MNNIYMHIHIHNFPLFSFVTNFGEWVRAPARRNEDFPWPHLGFLHEGKPKPYSHAKWVQEFVWNEEAFRYDVRGFWAVVSPFFFGKLLVVVQYYLYVLPILFISCDFVFPAGLRPSWAISQYRLHHWYRVWPVQVVIVFFQQGNVQVYPKSLIFAGDRRGCRLG